MAISSVQVFTGESLSEPRTVYVRDGVIVEATSADEVVDGAGHTLLPGLIDTHMHITMGIDDLRALAQWGVTTGLDMGAWPVEKVTALRGANGVADIRSPHIPAVGSGSILVNLPEFPSEAIVTEPTQAGDFVDRRVAEGADYIKIVAEASAPEGPDADTVAAIATAAHERGKKVVAHATTVGAFHVALGAGIDYSTHVPLDAVLDDWSISRMAAEGVVSIPTLVMMQGIVAAHPDSGLSYENASKSVAAMHAAGIPVLVGTDANSVPGWTVAPRHGESLHRELELLVEAGLTPLDALRGATTVAAQLFGLDDRGVVETGRRADLVLVQGNPLEDVAATREIRGVWIAGRRVR